MNAVNKFHLIVQILGPFRDVEWIAFGQNGGIGFAKEDGFLWQFISEFFRMCAIIPANTDYLHRDCSRLKVV
jgi:hypothetical protein